MKTSKNAKKQLLTLAFFARYTGWNSYNPNTLPEIKALADQGFLEMNEYGQARFTGKCYN
jgi:hypothetical protein